MASVPDNRVLVTGGTGFIGRALVPALGERGWRVTVLTRDAAAANAVLGADVALTETLDGQPMPNAMVNLAGENLGNGGWNAARKRAFVASRVGTTRRLIEFIQAAGARPKVLISGSAVGYYGARGDDTVTEDEPPGDEFQSDLCRQWEAEALRARALGVRVCLLRTGVVLDADGGALRQMLTPFRLGLGGYYGSGRQWMPWIHRVDMVRAIVFLLEQTACSGAFNCTAPRPATNKGFAKALGRALRRPALLWVPAPVVRLLLGEMAHLLLTGQQAVPQRLQDAGFAFRYPDADAALAEIVGRD